MAWVTQVRLGFIKADLWNFTGQMPLLQPKQQCQCTEGTVEWMNVWEDIQFRSNLLLVRLASLLGACKSSVHQTQLLQFVRRNCRHLWTPTNVRRCHTFAIVALIVDYWFYTTITSTSTPMANFPLSRIRYCGTYHWLILHYHHKHLHSNGKFPVNVG